MKSITTQIAVLLPQCSNISLQTYCNVRRGVWSNAYNRRDTCYVLCRCSKSWSFDRRGWRYHDFDSFTDGIFNCGLHLGESSVHRITLPAHLSFGGISTSIEDFCCILTDMFNKSFPCWNHFLSIITVQASGVWLCSIVPTTNAEIELPLRTTRVSRTHLTSCILTRVYYKC